MLLKQFYMYLDIPCVQDVLPCFLMSDFNALVTSTLSQQGGEPRALGAFDFPEGFPLLSLSFDEQQCKLFKLGQHLLYPAAALTAFAFACRHSQVLLENVTKQEGTRERWEIREGWREEAGKERERGREGERMGRMEGE